MDRNLGDDVAWYSDGDDSTDDETNALGPITALNYLNSQTAGWTNIPAITSYTYDNNLNGTTYDYGYQKLEIVNGIGQLTSKDGETITTLEGTSRARLITLEEAISLGCNEYEYDGSTNNTCPSWLYINLYKTGSTSGTSHLTLSTSITSTYSYDWQAYGIDYEGVYDSRFVHSEYGNVRPVITITK